MDSIMLLAQLNFVHFFIHRALLWYTVRTCVCVRHGVRASRRARVCVCVCVCVCVFVSSLQYFNVESKHACLTRGGGSCSLVNPTEPCVCQMMDNRRINLTAIQHKWVSILECESTCNEECKSKKSVRNIVLLQSLLAIACVHSFKFCPPLSRL